MSAQRFRVWFRKGERVRYISHLDVLRFWERAVRRAGLPLSYSQGFTPHPKLAFAAPLPLGFLGEAEVLDITLDERVDVVEFKEKLAAEASGDLAMVDAAEIAPTAPAPQSLVQWADYEVQLADGDLTAIREAAQAFLQLDSLTWTEEKKDKERTYDLRAGVASLTVQPSSGGAGLRMRLKADASMTTRPEQVMAAAFPGHPVELITRLGLVLDEPSPARDAWRRRGRFES
jgi:radical SAM-linked protein